MKSTPCQPIFAFLVLIDQWRIFFSAKKAIEHVYATSSVASDFKCDLNEWIKTLNAGGEVDIDGDLVKALPFDPPLPDQIVHTMKEKQCPARLFIVDPNNASEDNWKGFSSPEKAFEYYMRAIANEVIKRLNRGETVQFFLDDSDHEIRVVDLDPEFAPQ